MSFLDIFKKKKEPKITQKSEPEWGHFEPQDSWIPASFKPEKYAPPEWSRFQVQDDWEPKGCTRDNPYKPSPMPLGFYDSYKRPMRFVWDEVPDDYHQTYEVGSAERIYASRKTPSVPGYSSEAPGAGVLRYRRE